MYFNIIRFFRHCFPLVLAAVLIIAVSSACTKNKYSCESYHGKGNHKQKKNKNNYGALYSPKSKPPPKNYLIKNGR